MPGILPKDQGPCDLFIAFSSSSSSSIPGEKNLNDAHRHVHNLWQKVLEFIVLNAFSSFINAFSLIVEKRHL